MNLQFTDEREFRGFIDELKRRLASREIRSLDRPNLRVSAVLIPLLLKDGEVHVLLTKRTSKVGTHKGDVSFPGGARDPEDPDLLHTAVRETAEEVGIAGSDIEYIGEFDHFMSIAGFHVSTFVGAIPHPYEYRVSDDEIEACIEVPLRLFRDRMYDEKREFEFEGEKFNIYYYHYNGYEIWGLTARILTDFGARILCSAESRQEGPV